MNNYKLEEHLSTFYVNCMLAAKFVGDDYIKYKTSGGEFSNAYALDEANRIIKRFNLPLIAKIEDKNILKISAANATNI